MVALRPSETSVTIYRSTRCNIPAHDPRECVRSIFSFSDSPRSRLGESRDRTELINTVAAHGQGLFSTVASDAVTELGQRFRMPETSSPYINGFQQNGHMEPELVEDTFLFTSESVGEGHPGE
jgi:S-adenosylmethionine synthetase